MANNLSFQGDLYFCQRFFSRHHRARDRSAAKALLAKFIENFVVSDDLTYNTPYAYFRNFRGCIITDATGYFDIECTDVEYAYIRDKAVGVVIKNSQKISNPDNNYLLAFIDNVETSNTSQVDFYNQAESTFYVRVYFTVDWWDTILLSPTSANGGYEDVLASLCGTVRRAHVKDFIYSRGVYMPYMLYMDLRKELEPALYEIDEKRCFSNAAVQGWWVYVTSTKSWLDYQHSTTTSLTGTAQTGTLHMLATVPPTLYISQGSLSVVGISNAVIDTYFGLGGGRLKVTYTMNNDDTLVYDTITSGMYAPTQITDPDVVSMFVSDFFPFPENRTTIDNNTFTVEIPDTLIPAQQKAIYTSAASQTITKKDSFEVAATGVIGSEYQTVPILNYISEKRITPSICGVAYKDAAMVSVESLDDITTYSDYLKNCFPKSMLSPYSTLSVNLGEETCEIDINYNTAEDAAFTVNIIPEIGGYLIRDLSDRLYGNSALKTLHSNNTYERALTLDEVTALQAQASNVKALGNVASGIINAIQGIAGAGASAAGGNIGGLVTGLGQAARGSVDAITSHYEAEATLAESDRKLRNGETGAKLANCPSGGFITPLTVKWKTPHAACLQSIRENMARFGYTTYLQPWELFSDDTHERRYFRYVGIDNCYISNTTLYNNEIRASIEQMFSDGVWLWNKSATDGSFGNLEIANPIEV